MSFTSIKPDSLVLYRGRAARVLRIAEKVEIELPDGNLARVRLKDVQLLHPGPMHSLEDLHPLEGDVRLAWEILIQSGATETYTLADLAELIYGEYTPASAWAAWEHVQDGLYFQGTLTEIRARSEEQVSLEIHTRHSRQTELRAREEFLSRLRIGQVDACRDQRFLREIEELAFGRRKESRILRHLGRSERPESAHALLLELGYWNEQVNPYPARLNVSTSIPQIDLPELPDEARLDLTHLPAFAIDDRDNQDPDDAISLEDISLNPQGEMEKARVWVHVADVAALVRLDEPADLEARARGATLYLPEGQVPMLPSQAIQRLGLGLQEVSPALSFCIDLDAIGKINLVNVHPSWVKVKRMSYEEVEAQIEEQPFRDLCWGARTYSERRRRQGALFIDMPEVLVRVVNGKVHLRLLERLRSRDLVREYMLMAGEAVADFARQRGIPLPFVVQEPLSNAPPTELLGEMERADMLTEGDQARSSWPNLALAYAILRNMPRGHVSTQPAAHAGIGLPCYCRATSPLRRYLDLVVHQQLRRYLTGESLISEHRMLALIGAAEAASGSLTQVEALSRRHWTLVYLLQHPDWQGDAVLVEQHEWRGKVIIPDLALETDISLQKGYALNQVLRLKLKGVSLPELEAHFHLIAPE